MLFTLLWRLLPGHRKPPAGESSAGGFLYVLTLHEGLIYYG